MSARPPSTWGWSGRTLGLLAILVLAIPITVAVLLVTEFSILSADEDEPNEAVTAGTGTNLLPAAPSLILEPPPPDEPAPVARIEQIPLEESDLQVEEDEDVYTVVAGDTLGAIARRFQTTIQALAAYNDLANPDALRVGQELRIPPPDFTPEPPATTPDDEGAIEEPAGGTTTTTEASPGATSEEEGSTSP